MSGSPSQTLSRLIVALLAAGATSGCESLAVGKGEFSCEGYPSHPMCLPTSAVYALTESSESLQAAGEPSERETPLRVRTTQDAATDMEPTSLEIFSGETMPEPDGRTQAAAPLADGQTSPPGLADEALLLPRSTDPLPLRLPAQIMRIWLAPWEDDHGDLHATGYVFTEIAPRTWTLAEGPAPISHPVLKPLQVAQRDAAPAPLSRATPAPDRPSAPPAPRAHDLSSPSTPWSQP